MTVGERLDLVVETVVFRGHGLARHAGQVVFVETNDKFAVAPSRELQQAADDRFGEETYYVKVDTSLPERAPRRWERRTESADEQG